jgi:predicted lipoprotein with Yx(FWY)xxD motif
MYKFYPILCRFCLQQRMVVVARCGVFTMKVQSFLSLTALMVISAVSAQAAYGDTTPAPVAPALINAITNGEGETLIADAIGKTLYTFDLDIGSATPVCKGDCSEVWPPYILSTEEAATLQAPLGSIVRANKKIQLTYESKPVYTYAFDRLVSDEKGDGVGGVWHYIEIKK